MRIIYVSTSDFSCCWKYGDESWKSSVFCWSLTSVVLVVKAADLLLLGRVITDIGEIKETCPYLAFFKGKDMRYI